MGLLDLLRRPKKPQNAELAQEFARRTGGEPVMRALTLLGSDITFKHGLAGPAIAGVFRSDDFTPENFVPNRTFIEVLHRVIREHGPNVPGFEQAAREQGKGGLAIIDRRTPEGPNGNVPPEDILGLFVVADGRASAASYSANPNYRVFTKDGLTKLPEPLHAILLAELTRLTADQG
jgi:hypothetical protein